MKYKIRLRGDADTRRYWLNDIELKPKRSQKLFNHSPDGFNHGYGGSGPAQLALAILLELTDDDNLSVRRHQDVKFKYIAGLPQGEDFDEELEIEIL